MRASTTTAWAFALSGVQLSSALNGARTHKFNMMADMGLLPDGTPMEEVNAAAQFSSLRIAAANMPPPPPEELEDIVPEYVSLPIDHFAKNKDYSWHGTFNNRFWVAEAAYKPGGPVFIYDVGEGDAEPNALFRLQNDTSFFKQLVAKYNGIGIVWEHRFYGNSSPELVDINTPPEAFQFLTTAQALADIDKFAKQFKRKNIKQELTPNKTPWIFVGGSYPAMRAAFMRDKYPDTIYASFASSAPVEAQIDMSVYFEPVWRGLNKYGFGNCTRDINAAITHIDKTLERSPKQGFKLKEQFLGLGGGNNTDSTFADALTVIFSLWQSYGVDGGAYSLRNLCDWISTDPVSKKTSPAEGWAKSKGANFTISRWAEYPRLATMINNYMDTECSGDINKLGNCDLNRRFSDPSMISWTWQYCTEWGFFQSANLGPRQLVSKFNSLRHQRDICHRQFPTAPVSLFPDWPAVDRTNRIFGGIDLRPSNVYWSGGEFDPWRTLSPLTSEPGFPKPRKFTNPPKCGEETDEDEIFGYVMPDAEHCFDFRTYFAGGEVSRKYFTNALDKWLKCYKPKKGVGVKCL